jgi:cellulose synthase/poly-beta-1,6-N-acetylglucosamine synthase-like glycosyltransferase
VIDLIPAHNEAASIRETISSLRRPTRPPDEIIVVSDNSSDATDDRSMLHGAKVVVTGCDRTLRPCTGVTGRRAGVGDLARRGRVRTGRPEGSAAGRL